MSYKDILNIPTTLAVTPAYVQQKYLDVTEAAINGEFDVVDPGNPFIHLLEMASQGQAAAMINTDAKLRRVYRTLSNSYKDLYPHMADDDYIGRFSKPGTISDGGIQLALEMNQIVSNAILDGISGNQRLIIPQDTQFYAGDVYYYMHHPIVIDILTDESVVTYFDLTYTTPLSDRASNLIETARTTLNGIEFLLITIPVEQIRSHTRSAPVDLATGWSMTEQFEDMFYYARAYFTSDNVNWTEMSVSHDEQVHDASRPTMILTVAGNQVTARIPDIYITNNMVGSNVRIDIFSTKGSQEIDLTEFGSDAWNVDFNNYSGRNIVLSNGIRNITNRFITIYGKSINGQDELSFKELRDKVNYNLEGKPLPVTEAELTSELIGLGYGVAKQKDTVMERVFTASRSIDSNLVKRTTSGLGVTVDSVIFDPSRTDVPNSISIANDRVTVRPNALYKFDANGITMVPDADRLVIEGLTGEVLADRLNTENFFYTPLHYILDNSNSNYHARAYYMDAPVVRNRRYIENNPAMGFLISIANITLSKDNDNFKVLVETEHPALANASMLQLVFKDNENNRRHLTSVGTVVTAKSTNYEFVLETNMDIDSDDNVWTTNVLDDAGVITPSFINLNLDCKILFLSDTGAITPASFDGEVIRVAYPNASVISHEAAVLQFAQNLSGLFRRSRSVLSPITFERHLVDVYETYPEDVYERDSSDRLIYTIDPNTNKPVFNKLHDAGEIRLDNDGNQVIKHAAGSIKIDAATNLPIVVESTILHYELYMMLIDARYLFSTTNETKTYLTNVMENVINFIDIDIAPFQLRMFEQSELYFEPTSTIKNARIRLDGRRVQNHNTALTFKLTYLLSRSSNGDDDLRKNLTEKAKLVIDRHLKSNSVSVANIAKDILTTAGDEVLDVKLDTPFGIATFGEMLDNNAQFSIRARLLPLTNGLMDVADDIDIEFIYEN